MRLTGFLAFALLSISILSFGVNGSVFADNHDLLPVNASTDSQVYANGQNVIVSGNLKDYDPNAENAGAITYVVKSPDNNLVTIGQLVPNSDGTFTFSFKAGGALFKTNGDYTIETKYGGLKANVTCYLYHDEKQMKLLEHEKMVEKNKLPEPAPKEEPKAEKPVEEAPAEDNVPEPKEEVKAEEKPSEEKPAEKAEEKSE